MNSFFISPTPHLASSIDFYNRAGFKVDEKEGRALVTDGKAFIEINSERYIRAGLCLFRDSWDSIIGDFGPQTSFVETEHGYIVNDPSGTWVYLNHGSHRYNLTPEEDSFSILGGFAGMSLEVISIQGAIEFYEKLGFEKTYGSAEQGWVTLQNDDKLTISLMKPLVCPHLFFNPSLTYFNGGNNLEVIENIRKAGIPFTEEITHFNKEGKVDNVIIRDPGGFGFFIFND